MFVACKKEIVTNTTSTQCTLSSLDAVETELDKASASLTSAFQAPYPTKCPQTLISNSQQNTGKSNNQATPPLSTEPILKPNNNRFVLYQLSTTKSGKCIRKH